MPVIGEKTLKNILIGPGKLSEFRETDPWSLLFTDPGNEVVDEILLQRNGFSDSGQFLIKMSDCT